MIDKAIKKLNISYARYLKNRIADKYRSPDEISRAERHSNRVALLKEIILRIILISIIAIVIWPLTVKNMQGHKVNFASSDNKSTDGKSADEISDKGDVEKIPVMLKPRFFGNDDNGQPYRLSADSGVSVSESKVVLSNIKGDMSLKDNSKLGISSLHGDYFIKKKEISLIGDVEIDIDKGYNFKTNTAYIIFKENMATGSEKVSIKGVIGDIEANGFIVKNSGDEIFFFGGVELVSDPKEVESEK